MKFKYKRCGRDALRPVVPVELVNGSRTIPYEVLVDSGADMSIFDAEIGELAGIDVEAGEKRSLGGVTGAAEIFYVHKVTLVIGGLEFKTLVGFLPRMASFGYGVVGQRGFFDRFVVKFDFLKEEVELKERK